MRWGMVGVLSFFTGVLMAQVPIVLVHGFLGFGRDEFSATQTDFYYWGGFQDVETDLNQKGFQTLSVAVGPVSSNWDRACEVYAILKGGRVDYGAAHAQQHHHDRFGRTYQGVLRGWGDGSQPQIHLIGHSQGGQTIRALTALLADGSPSEREASPTDVSPLFQGGKRWVRSVTTLSTPHDGTSLAAELVHSWPSLQKQVGAFASMMGWNSESAFYDFKLDHWGFKSRPGESASHYLQRVFESGFWDAKDTSAYDLQPVGASQLNRWARAVEGVYYFSWSTVKTQMSPTGRHHIPEWGMNPVLIPFAFFIGSYGQEPRDWPNDGLVPVRSMDGPRLGSRDIIRRDGRRPVPGVWNHRGLLRHMDHFEIIGWFDSQKRDPRVFFRKRAEELQALP